MHERVLLISDDHDAGQAWGDILTQTGLRVFYGAPAAYGDEPIDLVVLVHERGADSLERCRQLRAQGIGPVLLLAGAAAAVDPLAAYEAGADEYIPQPVSPALLLAKVTAWLHRTWVVPLESLDAVRVGGFLLDPQRRRLVRADGVAVGLTSLEFRLLHLLMWHAGRPLDTKTIVVQVWGAGGPDAAVLARQIDRLRRKLEPDPDHPHHLQTVAGEGYVFVADW